MTAQNPEGLASQALSAEATPKPERLKGSLGVAGIVFMVVAASSPLTVVAGAVPVALAIGNGAGLPAAYLVIAVILLLFSVGYALMSRHTTNAGAFYAYITRGLGRPLGLGGAFVAIASYTAVQAAVYGLFGSTVAGLVTRFGGPTLPWWLYVAVAMVLVGVLGYRNVDLSVWVLGILMLGEVVIITIVSLFVLSKGGAEGVSFQSFTPSAFFSGSPGIGIMFAVASFTGFEATAIYGEEARNPRRTVPIATYVAVILIGVFYAFASWAVVIAQGPSKVVQAATAHLQAGDLTFATAHQYVGATAETVMQVLMVTSLFAVLLAFHNAVARYVFSLGRETVLPHVFGRTHPRHGSPHLGSLVQTASAIVVVGVFVVFRMDPVTQLFSWMSGVTTLGILLLMALTCLAVIAFFGRTKADTRLWHTKIAPVLGFIGLVYAIWLVIGNFTTLIGGSSGLAFGFEIAIVVLLLAGVVIALRWKRSRPNAYEQLGSFKG